MQRIKVQPARAIVLTTTEGLRMVPQASQLHYIAKRSTACRS